MDRTSPRTALSAGALLVGLLAGPVAALQPDAPALAGAARVPVGSQVTAVQTDAQTAQERAAAARLGERVSAALSTSGAGTVAAAVQVDGLGTVLRRNAALQLPPASTQKSFVSGAALLRLGTGARFTTQVAALTRPRSGVVHGDLWLVAGGDPYLTSTGLRALARSVRSAGVAQVTGHLRLDDSRYDARRNAAGWKASWVPEQSGPLSALAVDKNRWRRDSAFLADPALPNAVKFRDYLRAEGVAIGGVSRQRRPSTALAVTTTASASMSTVVRRLLKDSDNFAAELLLKEMGRVVSGKGTSYDGLAAVRAVLADLGVTVGAGADGSGLSSLDRQNPDSQVALLRALDASPVAAAFRAALPIACRDGTLRRRMCDTAAEGRAFAKTGTLSGVRSLAGFTRTRSGRVVRFGFQLTGVQDGTRARAALDRAVVVLAAATE